MENMDFIANDKSQGELAAYMMKNGKMDPGRLRPFVGGDGRAYMSVYKGGDASKPENYANVPINNATLRRDEWKSLDEAVLEVSRTRLNGVQDLIDNGLVYNLGNAMGTTVLEWHDVSDAQSADLTMDGVSRSKGDRVDFSHGYLPIPIIHADYEINERVLAASRNMGNALDTTMAERAARKVAEKLEEMLFTSTTYTFGGGTIYSYLNHPDVNTRSISAWTSGSSKTPAEMVEDVLVMKQDLIDDYHYGPYMLYIPTAYETLIDGDYSDSLSNGTTNTIRERILKIAGIKGIKVVDTLPSTNLVLVQMTSDVVRLVRGLPLQNVEWSTEGNFVHKYKVLTIQVPQIRSDYNGRSGILLVTAS
jgi:hypothetical protein